MIFWGPRRRRVLRCRALGGRGRRESDSQVGCRHLVSVALVDVMRLHTVINRVRQVARCFCLVTVRSSLVVDMMLHDDHGSAWRRRQRRLRSWWRHEQQSVARPCPQPSTTATPRWRLKKKYHDSRAQNTDRAEAAHYAPRRQTPRAARGPELFQLFEEELSGARPPPLVEVRPQERVLQQTLEHADDVCPFVQILDVPVPQTGDQLGATLKHLDQADSRAGYRSAQDLVVIPSFSRAQGSASAADGGTVGGSAVDRICFFFARACGAERGHSSSSRSWRSGLSGEVFKVYAQDRIQLRLVEQNTMTFKFRVVEVFKIYVQDRFFQLLHPHRLVPWMRFLKGFFALSPWIKNAKISRTERTGCGLYSMDAGSSSGSCDLGLGMWRDKAGTVCRWYLLDNPEVHWDEPG